MVVVAQVVLLQPTLLADRRYHEQHTVSPPPQQSRYATPTSPPPPLPPPHPPLLVQSKRMFSGAQQKATMMMKMVDKGGSDQAGSGAKIRTHQVRRACACWCAFCDLPAILQEISEESLRKSSALARDRETLLSRCRWWLPCCICSLRRVACDV